MGTALKMGAAYFPTVLGALLILVGIIAILRSLLSVGEKIASFAWREGGLVLAPVVVFGMIARGAGLAPAILLLVLASAYASINHRWGASLALAVGMTLFSILVFIKALGVPLPALGPWFGG